MCSVHSTDEDYEIIKFTSSAVHAGCLEDLNETPQYVNIESRGDTDTIKDYGNDVTTLQSLTPKVVRTKQHAFLSQSFPETETKGTK